MNKQNNQKLLSSKFCDVRFIRKNQALQIFGDIIMNGYKVVNSGDPIDLDDCATKGYVDNIIAAQKIGLLAVNIPTNPIDSVIADTNVQAMMQNIYSKALLLAGGTVQGPINMGLNSLRINEDPSNNYHLVNKLYVDNYINNLIKQPSNASASQYLMYNGTSWIGSNFPAATTVSAGVTQVIDSLTVNNNKAALSANQGKVINDKISKIITEINAIGTYNADTSLIATLTPTGVDLGIYTVGQDLPDATIDSTGCYFIVSTAGTPSTTSKAPSKRLKVGDWVISMGNKWSTVLADVSGLTSVNVAINNTYIGSSILSANVQDAIQTLDSNIINKIVDPIFEQTGQWLSYFSGSWSYTDLPIASLTTSGIVQLNDSITSNSITTAATSNSVRLLLNSKLNVSGGTLQGPLTMSGCGIIQAAAPTSNYDVVNKLYVDQVVNKKIPNPAYKSASQFLQYDGTTWNSINLPIANTTIAGIVRLSNDITSVSNTQAASTFLVYSKITNPVAKSAGQYLSYNGTSWSAVNLPQGSLTTSGMVMLDDSGTSTSITLAATANSVRKVADVKITNPTSKALSQFLKYDGSNWIGSDISQASTMALGLVMLENVDSSSVVHAATANLVGTKITAPLLVSNSQLLQYNGNNWVGADVPLGSITKPGLVILDESGSSNSSALAATTYTVTQILNQKITNPIVKTNFQFLKYDGADWNASDLPIATTASAGLVKLDDTGISSSVELAATARSVYNKITNPQNKNINQYLQYNGGVWNGVNLPVASVNSSGVVQIDVTYGSTSSSKAAAAVLVNNLNNNLISNPAVSFTGQYLKYNGTTWDSCDLPVASRYSAGIVQLDNTVVSNSLAFAATSNAISQVNQLKINNPIVKNTGQYLMYDGTNWIASNLPNSSTTTEGIVQLDNSGSSSTVAATANLVSLKITNPLGVVPSQYLMYNGSDWVGANLTLGTNVVSGLIQLENTGVSTTKAATANLVKTVGDTKILNPLVKTIGDYLKYDGVNWNAEVLPAASKIQYGISTIDDVGSLNSACVSANRVRCIYEDSLNNTGGTMKGNLDMSGFMVTYSNTPNTSSEAVNKVYVDQLILTQIVNPSVKSASQFLSYNGTNWIGVNLPIATTSSVGVVELVNDLTTSDSNKALTALQGSILKAQYDSIVSGVVCIGNYNPITCVIESLTDIAAKYPTFVLGLDIPADSISILGLYFIVSAEGVPVSSTTVPKVQLRVGDWVCSTGAGWGIVYNSENTFSASDVALNISYSRSSLTSAFVQPATVFFDLCLQNKIQQPLNPNSGDYLKYSSGSWSGGSLPISSTSLSGIVQLDDSGTSTSTTLAATANSVNKINNDFINKPLSASVNQYLKYNGSTWVSADLMLATTSKAGIVVLEDNLTSVSTTAAATANAITTLQNKLILMPNLKSSGQYLMYDGFNWIAANLPVATTTLQGLVVADDSGTSQSTTSAATIHSAVLLNAALIANPISKSINQYLTYNGTSWIASNLPIATLMVAGIAKMDDTGLLTSTTIAATANSVSKKITAPTGVSASKYLQYNGTSWIGADLPVASTTQKGVVQLDNTIGSTSTTMAATANAVKIVSSSLITNPSLKSTNQFLSYNGTDWVGTSLLSSTLTIKGIVALDDTGISTSKTLAATANSLSIVSAGLIFNPSVKSVNQYLKYNGTNWISANLPIATTTSSGIISLDDTGTSNSVTKAATANSVAVMNSSKIINPTTKTAGQFLSYNGSSWVASNIPSASTLSSGVVQLDDTGLVSNCAATANFVSQMITAPTTVVNSQYLQYNGTAWIASNLSLASTTGAGIVQLDNTGTSTSTTLAATANIVNSINTALISNPVTKSNGNYLLYDGFEWKANSLPAASTTVSGIVQLDDTGTSNSTALAATANSVTNIVNNNIANPATKSSGQYLKYSGTAWVAANLPVATTSIAGIVRLDDSGTSTSTTLAATAHSVSTKILNPATKSSGQYLKYSGTAWVAANLPAATTLIAGVVQLDDSGTSTSTTLAATANSISTKILNPAIKSSNNYLIYDGVNWNAANLSTASTTVVGIVQLDDTGTSTSTTTAATANSVAQIGLTRIVNPGTIATSNFLKYSGTAWVAENAPVASTTVAGIVQLDDSGISTSTTLAATANSVSLKITAPSSPATGSYLKYDGTNWISAVLPTTSTTVAGIAQLDDSGTSTSTTLVATANSVSLKITAPSSPATGNYLKYDGTNWVSVALTVASTTVAGIVQLNDSGTSTSTTLAATANSAVSKITAPSSPATSSYLKYDGTNWTAVAFPQSSTTVSGIVKLFDGYTSSSTTLAATANSVKTFSSSVVTDPATKATSDYLKYDGTSWVASALPVSTTTVAGIVQLDDSGTSTSTTLAATANSVSLKITAPSSPTTGSYLKYDGTSWVLASLSVSSTTVAGIVQLDDSGTSTSTTLAATANSVSLKITAPLSPTTGSYLKYDGTNWTAASPTTASTTVVGTVQLDDTGTSTSTTLAATANSVRQLDLNNISNPATKSSGQYLSYNGTSWVAALTSASTSSVGIVQLDDSGASMTLAATARLVSTKITAPASPATGNFLIHNGTSWISGSAPIGTTTSIGCVQLDNTGTSTSTTLAATPNSLIGNIPIPSGVAYSNYYLKYDGTNWVNSYVFSVGVTDNRTLTPTQVPSGTVAPYFTNYGAQYQYQGTLALNGGSSTSFGFVNLLSLDNTSPLWLIKRGSFGGSTWTNINIITFIDSASFITSGSFAAAGSPYTSPRAFIQGNHVYLTGMLTTTAAITPGPAVEYPICTFSSPYIPSVSHLVPVFTTYGVVRITITSTGAVKFGFTGTISISLPIGALISLANVSYRL